jgi:hypothetical protein
MAASIQAIRCDDPRYFGPGGRVDASRLFPLPASYRPVPGLKVLDGGAGTFDELYSELGALMARADAMDPDSDTARQIAAIDARLTDLEEQEASEMRAAFEARRLMPIDAGATLDRKLQDALRALDPDRADDPAADDGEDPAP